MSHETRCHQRPYTQRLTTHASTVSVYNTASNPAAAWASLHPSTKEQLPLLVSMLFASTESQQQPGSDEVTIYPARARQPPAGRQDVMSHSHRWTGYTHFTHPAEPAARASQVAATQAVPSIPAPPGSQGGRGGYSVTVSSDHSIKPP